MAGGQGGSSNANANPGGAGGTGYTGGDGTPGSGFGGGGGSSGGSGGGGGAAGGGSGAAGGSGSGANSATSGYAGGKGGTASHPNGYAGTGSGNTGGFTPAGAGGGGGGFNGFTGATLGNGIGANVTGGSGGAGGSDYSVGGGGGGGAGGYGAVVTGAASNGNAGGLYGGAGGAGGGAGQGGANGGPGAAGGGGGAGAAFSAPNAAFNNAGKVFGGKGGIGGSGAYGVGEGGGGPGGAGGAGTVFTKAQFALINSGNISGGSGGQGGDEGEFGPNGTGGSGGAGVVGSQGMISNTSQIMGGMGGMGGTGTSPFGTTGGNGGTGGDGVDGASLTITNLGTIAAGAGGLKGAAGSAGAAGNAVDLSGGTSSLTLGNTTTTGTITGAIGVGGSLSIDPGTATGNAVTFANLVHDYSGTVAGSLTKVGVGTLTLSGANTFSGGTTIQAGVLDLASARVLTNKGAFQSAAAGSGAVTYAASGTATARLTLETTAQPASGGTFGNALTNFTAATESLDLRGLSFTGPALYATNGTTLTVTGGTNDAMSETFTLTNGALAYTAQSDGAGGTLVTAVCYAGGTRIRVARNGHDADVAVEDLVVGDVAVTASGAHRPIRWLGHRTIDCRRHPRPSEVMPICVAAHAFGQDRPARDLRVSPGHALCVDVLGEVLIPAGALVNGTTIVREDVDQVTYWHVELDSHDILLAENMPAESYLEMGNRSFFAEGEVVAFDASPDVPAVTHAGFCRPFHAGGALVEAVRAQVASPAAPSSSAPVQTENTRAPPATWRRMKPSTASSSISASWPKPPGTCSTSSCGASARVASGRRRRPRMSRTGSAVRA